MKKEIDIGNYQAVGARGDQIVVILPKRTMTKEEALVHAAWLVAMADDNEEFEKILSKVMSI